MALDAAILGASKTAPAPVVRLFCSFFNQPANRRKNRKMEYIYGKQTGQLDGLTLAARLVGYTVVRLDLGTGDGRYVEQLARQNKQQFVIGIDACRENLTQASKRASGNTLFLIANGETLPAELRGIASFITLNFPWGSLLEGLFEPQSRLITCLQMVAKEDARLELRLNESAVHQASRTLESACEQVVTALERGGFALNSVQRLKVTSLRSFPSSWARRLASGREGEVLSLSACYLGQQSTNPAEAEAVDLVTV